MFASKDLFFSRPSGYQISRSVRLRSSASGYFNRTPATASNRTTFTFSFWNKFGALSSAAFFFAADDGTLYSQFAVNANNQIYFGYVPNTSGTVYQIGTSAVLRDPSAYYHIQFAIDTTQATNTNRIKIYINGVQQTLTDITGFGYPPQNSATQINQNVSSMIGRFIRGANNQYDGYLTEVNFIDGQALTPSSFGQYNANGVWSPIKYAGTYGTNGFYLNFSDNSASTATTIGKDNSGNGNNWTPNNISVTAGTTYDSMLDSPTPYADGGNGRGNYCVGNPLQTGGTTWSSGNLNFSLPSGTGNGQASIAVTTGKWYWEMLYSAQANDTGVQQSGVTTRRTNAITYSSDGSKYVNGTNSAYGATYTTGDVISVALDMDGGTVTFYKNNASQGSISLSGAGITEATTTITAGGGVTTTGSFNFGQRPFTYTPPTGFVALNTQNLSTPTIANGAAYMAATTYTGTGATLSVSNAVNSVSFQPDFIWIKDRSNARSNVLQNSVTGAAQYLISDTTSAEATSSSGVTAINSNGFTVGTQLTWNGSAETYVGWQWKAGTTSASNTSGTITSTVSVGATQGFSVVTYTGTGSNATVGHGLGVAPKMVIVKNRAAVTNWIVWQTSFPGTDYMQLNTTIAKVTAPSIWNSTSPTSSVISIGTDVAVNASTNTYVAYCFSEVAGFSKFGSYTGNGSANGPFVYLGFRPRFIMIKRTDAVSNWTLRDTSRDTSNTSINDLYANSSNAESSAGANIDILSNGFKCRDAGGGATNASGGTYIYAAFAENPFKYSLAR